MKTVPLEKRIALIVVDENTLGFTIPEMPDYYQPLHCSILRGATRSPYESHLLSMANTVRLASERDFDDYRVSMTGFKNSPEYIHA